MRVRTKQHFKNSDEFRDDWIVTKLFIGEDAYIDVGSATDEETERLVKIVKRALMKERDDAPDSNWLIKSLRDAEKEVAKWPAWMKAVMNVKKGKDDSR
jgi:hypothetical protein